MQTDVQNISSMRSLPQNQPGRIRSTVSRQTRFSAAVSLDGGSGRCFPTSGTTTASDAADFRPGWVARLERLDRGRQASATMPQHRRSHAP
jgi:hypothetical protein